MSNTPTLADVLLGAMETRLEQDYRALPGRVEAYDTATQRASVQPLIRKARIQEDGTRTAESLPVITDVPVVFPGCGSYSITFPLAAGDTVLLIFASGSLDKWLEVGGEVDPLDDRRNGLSDAIAIPGLRPKPGAISGTSGTAMVLQSAGEIQAGGTGAVALKSDVQKVIDGIAAAAVSAGDGGATFKTNFATYIGSNPLVGTTKLRG